MNPKDHEMIPIAHILHHTVTNHIGLVIQEHYQSIGRNSIYDQVSKNICWKIDTVLKDYIEEDNNETEGSA